MLFAVAHVPILKLFFFLCLISFTATVCDHRNNKTEAAGLRQTDVFCMATGINEVIMQQIIKCHLRVEMNWCFQHAVTSQ